MKPICYASPNTLEVLKKVSAGSISVSVVPTDILTFGLYDAHQVGRLKSALRDFVHHLEVQCQDPDEDTDPDLLHAYSNARKLLKEIQ
jgi:hypothetical protein